MHQAHVNSGRHPFEVTLLLATLGCGIALIVSDARPRSVALAMPGVVEVTWEWSLVVVGLVGLIGLVWPGHVVTALGIELGAMVTLGSSTGMYAIALFAVAGDMALAAGTFIVAVAVASWWRAAQIWTDLRELAHAASELPAPPAPPPMERDDP
ncbi:hypothetical protein AB0J86_35210 [Micromonospora sp. NPDC049559]|uniref:hypothetical protein n=1 Tax=Micromonospora sp. NPDC049559 TaxID=3155923 RepID=UPI003421DBB4